MRLLLTMVFVCVMSVSVVAASLLTNADVVAMAGLGLSEEIILVKVKSSPNAFDTSPGALKVLQENDVSVSVIAAMIEAQGNVASPEESKGTEIPEGDNIELVSGEKEIALIETRVRTEVSNRKSWIPIYGNFAGPENYVFLPGARADREMDSNGFIIKTTIPKKRLRLIRLDLHEHSGDRFVVFSKGQSPREIELVFKAGTQGWNELVPVQALENGEYAFLVTPEMKETGRSGFMAAAMKQAMEQSFMNASAYDFRVEAANVAKTGGDSNQ